MTIMSYSISTLLTRNLPTFSVKTTPRVGVRPSTSSGPKMACSTIPTAASATEAIHRRFASLTSREREVMARVVGGLLNKQIAAELGTSENTVKTHRHQVMEKMGANSLPELVRMADRLGSLITKS
jgi:DNA-binding NarL/FixJ family response regulator